MRKHFIKKTVFGMALLGTFMMAPELVKAGNSHVDINVSNVSGMVSSDPYSMATSKDDGELNYYLKLTSLTNATYVNFTPYRYKTTGQSSRSSVDYRVGLTSSYDKTYINSGSSTKKYEYNVDALLKKDNTKNITDYVKSGYKYYLYFQAPTYTANVHAVGTYCP